MDTMNNFLYKELSHEVIGCAYAAFKYVGVGFNEIMYHKIFHNYLIQKGLNANYKVPFHLDYQGERIADIEVDEIVENKLIVELKCIHTDFIPESYAQIMTYLKMTGIRFGLLINFGLHKAYPKRIIFDEQRKPNIERWDKRFFHSSSTRKLIDTIIASIHCIDKSLGIGYHNKIYQATLSIELKRNKVAYNDKVCIDIKFGEMKFSPFEIDYWLVEKSILVGILAGKGDVRVYDIFRMRSYLKKLNLHHGIIAYWSNKNLQILGIYEA